MSLEKEQPSGAGVPGRPAAWRPYVRGMAVALVPFALIFLLYAPVISLPYFWDDYPLYIVTTTRSFGQLWAGAVGLPYYRPLTFTLYKLFFEALPYGASFWPHVLMLGLHALNSLLVGKLAVRALCGPRQAGDGGTRLRVELAGAVLFSVYPFAVLPVAHFASLGHPLVTLLALAAVLAGLEYVHTRRTRYLALTLVAAALAPFAHEAGVGAGLLASLTAAVVARPQARRRAWFLALTPLLSGLFVPVWLLVPKTREAASGFLDLGGWDSVLAKVAFFLQAPTYPVQPLAALLIRRAGLWDLGAIFGVGGVALIAVAILLVRGRRLPALGLALGWAAAASLPSIAALPFSYIVTSPRLLYLAGVGGALLWTAVLVQVTQSARGSVLRGLAAVALAALTVAVPLVYIGREVRLHTLALTPLRQLVGIAHQQPDERHLVINTVNWLSYSERWYPLGHDGVTVLTSYSGLPALIYINSGVQWQGAEEAFTELLPSGYGYFLSTPHEAPETRLDVNSFAAVAPAYDRVWLTTYGADSTAVEYVGQVRPSETAAPDAYRGSFEDKLYLTASRLTVEGATATLELEWLYRGPDPQATIFRNIFDCAGNVVGLGSGAALGGMLSLAALAPGSAIVDVKPVALDSLSPDGCYRAEVGLFRADGSRVTIHAPDGSEYANGLILIEAD